MYRVHPYAKVLLHTATEIFPKTFGHADFTYIHVDAVYVHGFLSNVRHLSVSVHLQDLLGEFKLRLFFLCERRA
jgi:hypothetical protein